MKRYRGRYLIALRATKTRSRRRIAKGLVVLAVENEVGGWVPVLHAGRFELVRPADFETVRKRVLDSLRKRP